MRVGRGIIGEGWDAVYLITTDPKPPTNGKEARAELYASHPSMWLRALVHDELVLPSLLALDEDEVCVVLVGQFEDAPLDGSGEPLAKSQVEAHALGVYAPGKRMISLSPSLLTCQHDDDRPTVVQRKKNDI